tara:strand:- start:39 stop:254 length:216 start_codon:yes stop_codon:yes gene_type:complete
MINVTYQDYDLIKFQDVWYDFIAKETETHVDGDHPHWNQICELRNKTFDLIQEIKGREICDECREEYKNAE